MPTDPPVLCHLAVPAPCPDEDLTAWCTHLRAALLHTRAQVALCDLSALHHVDLATVDALARVQLTARQLDRQVWFVHASPRLRALLELAGLATDVPLV